MMGYWPPDPNQLPTPGDEDHERRAAEEYAGRRRARRRIGWITLAVVAVVVVLVAHPWNHGTLTWHTQLSTGRMVTTVTDSRSGSHTVQLVVKNTEGKMVGEFANFNAGSGGHSGTYDDTLPGGTYTYVIYDMEGVHYSLTLGGAKGKRRIDSGTVTVP
jgi:hypothetical protein